MSDSEGELGIFEEPEGFYEAEKEPSFVDYTLQGGSKLTLRLVGHNPLWVGGFPAFFPPTRRILGHIRLGFRRPINVGAVR